MQLMVTFCLSRLTWTRDAEVLDIESSSDFSYDAERGQLVIWSMSSRLAGVYACQASNQYGSAHSRTVVLREAGELIFHAGWDV